MTEWINHHCNVVEVNGQGVLIEGPAGAGKSSLALGLLEQASTWNVSGNLVCDDQALLSARAGKLTAKVPQTLAGKIELRGFGVVEMPFLETTEIALVAKLVDDALVERMPEAQSTKLLGVELPLVLVPRRHELMARRIIYSWVTKPA